MFEHTLKVQMKACNFLCKILFYGQKYPCLMCLFQSPLEIYRERVTLNVTGLGSRAQDYCKAQGYQPFSWKYKPDHIKAIPLFKRFSRNPIGFLFKASSQLTSYEIFN